MGQTRPDTPSLQALQAKGDPPGGGCSVRAHPDGWLHEGAAPKAITELFEMAAERTEPATGRVMPPGAPFSREAQTGWGRSLVNTTGGIAGG